MVIHVLNLFKFLIVLITLYYLKYLNDVVSSRVAYQKKAKYTRLLMVIHVLNLFKYLIVLITLNYI